MKVNFIQGEQLGNDVQVIEQMMRGSVHVYGDVLDWYANWVKDFSVLAWGFTFRDGNHMAKFLESPVYVAMVEELRTKQGLRILAAVPTQPRVLFAKKAVASPDDLKDVKMRVPEIKTYLLLLQTFCTKPSRVAWAEVFLGLKTGVIDVYFMHRDNPDVPVGEFVDAIDAEVKAGRIRIYGGSNWTRERMDAAFDYAAKNGKTPAKP